MIKILFLNSPERMCLLVSGNVSLDVAREIYKDPECKINVRAGHHCGRLSPDEVYQTFATPGDLKVVSHSTYLRGKELGLPEEIISGFISDAEVVKQGLSTYKVVTGYDIDSMLGLYLFVEILKKHYADSENWKIQYPDIF